MITYIHCVVKTFFVLRATATLDGPEALAAVQFWHDMMYKYYVAPPAVPGKMWAGDLYKNNVKMSRSDSGTNS